VGKHPGYVYLLHFARPYRHARHYMGWAKASRLDARVAEELAGGSAAARLMQVVKAAGIEAELTRTWEGSRAEERRLKNLRNAPHLCPVCNPSGPWPGRQRPPKRAAPQQAARPPWWPDPGALPGPAAPAAPELAVHRGIMRATWHRPPPF
jgi:hypothetical protein